MSAICQGSSMSGELYRNRFLGGSSLHPSLFPVDCKPSLSIEPLSPVILFAEVLL